MDTKVDEIEKEPEVMKGILDSFDDNLREMNSNI